MTTKRTGVLQALAFVLATLGATALLVAAGLAEAQQPPSAATACHACPAPGPGDTQ
ncbi:MAG TPA: hypothetical protein VJ832_10560 [Variovorax sp.]|jgi:hypothetical protein|nr:hypothetical protein [Variovorax sp.]